MNELIESTIAATVRPVYSTVPMSEEQTKMLLRVLLICEQSDREEFFKEFFELDFISKIINKRIEVFGAENGWPIFDGSAVVMLSILADGNPGRAVLGLIETLEKAKERGKMEVDINFIAEYVYPMGFYPQNEFMHNFDYRREHRSESFNYII